MPILTSIILTAFVLYIGAWSASLVQGNFALLLFIASVITGAYWFADKLYFLPRRRKLAQSISHAAQSQWSAPGIHASQDAVGADGLERAKAEVLRQPWWLDWTAGLFPVILAVFLLRSFAYEPFRIPSGSMIPTLLVGDMVLVDKFTYGIRLPVLNIKLTAGKPLARGDVVVFRYPPNPALDYVKRVVGLPGDKVEYLSKRLYINGQEASKAATSDFFNKESTRYSKQFLEKFGEHLQHQILNDEGAPSTIPYLVRRDALMKENCHYNAEGVSCTVPPGHYYMLGDNRDNSEDSRYWGFVPDENVVGKAVLIWMNFGDLGRVGTRVE